MHLPPYISFYKKNECIFTLLEDYFEGGGRQQVSELTGVDVLSMAFEAVRKNMFPLIGEDYMLDRNMASVLPHSAAI